MTSKMQPNKVISDVNDCIVELKTCFSTTPSPINDDNTVLHRLEEKLEQILLLGMKDKPGLLGSKKSYWDYICTCFASTKRAHEGIQFVKSISEIKTSLGRGRALIRFCLMQKCLADTLQTCFMNQKTTRDFYTDRSVPVQAKLWSLFITSLYDLNELNFDLTSRHAELDVTWPSFARKIFVSSENELSPSRNRSSTSLYSFSSQNEYDVPVVSDSVSLQADNASQMCDKQLVNSEMDKLTEKNVELSQKNQCLNEEVQSLMKEKVELELNVKGLQKECQCLQQKLSASFVKDANEIDVQKCAQEENIGLEGLLQDQQLEIKEKSVTLTESDGTNQDSPVHSITDSKTNSKTSLELQIKLLQDENIKLLQRIADFEHNVHSECDSENLPEMKSSTCENVTVEYALESKSSLPCSVDLKPEVNCLEQTLSNQGFHAVEEKADVESIKSKILGICDSELSATVQDADPPLKKFSDLNINKFLLETKRLISDIVDTLQMCDKSVSVTYQSRLNNIRDFFEIGFADQEKLKECLIQNHLIEKYVTFIKQFSIKQDNIISALHEKIDLSIKGNEDLYSKICILKDLLRSYGFKLSDEHKAKTAPLSADDSTLAISSCLNNDFIYDPLLKTTLGPVLDIFKSSFSRLNDLNLKIIKLHCDLNSSQELNNNLISRVQDQEMHLKGVTKELEEAKQLVSLMKEQHKKLQSTEGILKYDLQEKRKLMSKLKQQLETTREDWNQVRLKNSKSEVEWQNLRKEFVQRHKQTSEESGFIDDKGVEEQSALVIVPNECNFGEGNSSERTLISNCNIEIKDIPNEPKKSRLELLEEQCQILYSSLLKGSKKRQEIDNRLESICKATVKSNEVVHNKHFSNNHTSTNSCEDINDTFIDTSVEDIGEHVITDENLSNSPQSSSDIGSLHSDCSSCIPVNCSGADSVVSSCPLQSPETGSPHSVPCELDCAMTKCQHENAQVSDLSSFPDSEVVAEYPAESEGSFGSSGKVLCEEIISGTSSNSCTEPVVVATFSQVDSVLITEKDLEESLKHPNIETKEFSSGENKHLKSVERPKEISVLEQEKRSLQGKVQELEKKILIISTELDQTTQQLLLSKAAKEHEVAALQFQLNTEALKYERGLKQFSEQNTGLENMKKKITDQEELIHALEEALAEIREERESEQEHQWQELQELQSVLEAREQECISLSQDVEKLISFIEEERSKNDQVLSQFEKVKVYFQRDKDALESELINLQNDSKEMRKKLIKLLKEKDILWKRSDHLSYLHKAKINNRWVDDHEVSNCLGCKSNFSFILRKHHCRLCGRIFCYSCSNNWLLTASSSKRIRVCNECYIQYMEMKKDTRRGSDVPQVEDESEDEAVIDDLSINPRSSCSFNSDIPLSIADSIVSLPVKTMDSLKQSSPLFASAPDLRCSFKLDEGTCRSKSMVQENLLEEADENIINCDANENESADLELALDISDDSLHQTDKHLRIDNTFSDSAFCSISTNEIVAAKYGVTGDLIINAGEKTSLRILCQQYPMELQWSFSANNGIIPVILVHGGDSKNESEASVCYRNEHKTEDSMDLIYPGLYAFQFDNTSRKTTMKIQYSLKAKPSDKNTSIANLCSSL